VVWLEQALLDAYNPWFNISKVAGSCLGVKRTPEQIDKMRKRGFSKKAREMCRIACTGRIPWNKGIKAGKQSKELIEKRAKALRGRKRKPFSEEWKKNLSISHTGHKDSEETKRKKSEARKGKPLSDEHRRNLSIANMGKKKPPVTDRYRKKQSKIITEWWAKRKEMEINKLQAS